MLTRSTGSMRVCQARIAYRETPISLLTELRLRPWATSATARLRVLMSYTCTLCVSGRLDTQ
ncbi:hypothetical protein GCM10018980_41340 [Streptomyces capoamus]|uniref:Uncharacterized protein n=1 Tax=Streptomyces capoamus TaxID=68183 RepID=A0A919EXH2_9ACTN|nr:hypothetical protein GCM10018980_41340 [Streptomyces capoamus]